MSKFSTASVTPIHLLIDFVVDDDELLLMSEPGIRHLREAVVAGGATVLQQHTHQFEPLGYTALLVLAQSHASIHTWPEDRLVSIDVFACGPIDIDAILTSLRTAFRPTAVRIEKRERGIVGLIAPKP